jgi:hypothetical protein
MGQMSEVQQKDRLGLDFLVSVLIIFGFGGLSWLLIHKLGRYSEGVAIVVAAVLAGSLLAWLSGYGRRGRASTGGIGGFILFVLLVQVWNVHSDSALAAKLVWTVLLIGLPVTTHYLGQWTADRKQ